MKESFLDLVFEIIEAGFSLGFCNKEGALTVEYGEEDGYHYYVAGDGIKELRYRTHDREDFRGVVDKNGVWDVKEDIRTYFACVGYQLLEAGDLAKAAEFFERAVSEGYPIGYLGLALAAHGNGELEQAEARFAEAREAEAARWYGRTGIFDSFADGVVSGVWKKPRYERLREVWSKFLSIEPAHPAALFGRGLAHEELKMWLEASADFALALEGALPDQKRERARIGLVRCLVCEGQTSEAREALSGAADDGVPPSTIERLENMIWNPRLATRW